MSKRVFPLQCALLIGLFAIIWFAPLNLRHLVPSDEGRYAEIAREMLITGDWIVPRYNGYLYFEKPPLQTWFNALTFYIFGVGDWQARLYTALTGFAGVFLVGQTARLLFKSTTVGVYTALILASTPYWNALGHFNVLDMGLSFWMTLTLCSLLLAQRPDIEPTAQRYWMWGCWAGMALSLLSKGLIGIMLPGAVLVLYSLAFWDWKLWGRLHLFTGGLLFLALTLPWFILVELRQPGFADFFFIVQQFRRYLTPEQQRPGPWYYFIPVMILGFLPWLSLAAQSLWQSIKHIKPSAAHSRFAFFPRQSNGFSPIGLLWVWSALIFVFFSVSHSKLLSYTLPIAPAIALLLGGSVIRVTAAQWSRHFTGASIVSSIVLAGMLLTQAADYFFHFPIGNARTPHLLYSRYFIWVDVALFLILLGSLLARASVKHPSTPPPLHSDTRNAGSSLHFLLPEHPVSKALFHYASAWLLAITVAGTAHQIFGKLSSGVQLVPAIQAEIQKAPAGTPFYSVQMLDHTLPFYLRHTMIMVEHPDELRYGVTQEPEKWVPTLDAWIVRWQQDEYAFALLSPTLHKTLVARGLPMDLIASDSRRVVVRKPQVRSSSSEKH